MGRSCSEQRRQTLSFPTSRSHPHRAQMSTRSWVQWLGCGLTLLLGSQAGWAQVELPAQSFELYDKPMPDSGVDAQGRATVVLYADELNLSGLGMSPIRRDRQRMPDMVFVAKTLRVGPKTSFSLDGQTADLFLQSLRGGDLYLVADTLVINGQDNGSLVAPMTITHQGGYNPQDSGQFRSRAGRTYVFVNKVELAPEYVAARTKALNVSGSAAGEVPAAVMKVLSRNFSSGNSVHKAVAAGTSVKWSALGNAYQMWLDEEPAEQVIQRELGLVRQRTNPFDGQNIPDIVAKLADAPKYVPPQLLSTWYVQYLERSATVAQTAVWGKDYGTALTALRSAHPLAAAAPTAAQTAAKFKKAVADLQEVENKLAQESVVEDLSFPVDGGPPLKVTVIRDLTAGRVSVVPHQVLLSTVQDNGVFRVGFMSQKGADVQVSMLGQLTVDPGVLEQVRKKFPGATTEVRVADDLVYDTMNLGIGSSLVNGSVKVQEAGRVVFDLVLKGTQFTPTMLRLAQPFGIDASVHWKHQRLNLGDRTSRVNVALGRTELTLIGKTGTLSNPTSHAVEVDYVMDGRTVLTKGFPVRIAAGQSINAGCSSEFCYAPASAVRWVLPASQVDSWLVSMPEGSSVVPYVFENHLEDNSRLGEGRFLKVVLDVTYTASPGAAPQKTGSFTLGRRGTTEALRAWQFVSASGGGKLVISGRAHWEHGYHDLPARTEETTLTTIDDSWLAK